MKTRRTLAIIMLGAALAAGCTKEGKPSQPDWSRIPDPSEEPKGDGLLKPAPCDNKVVAHRCGAAEAGLPDNSLAALRYTKQIRAYGAECDVYWTKDNDVVVAHADGDYHVNGLDPFDHTVAEIRAAGKLSNGEEIPTLEEYLAEVMDSTCCTKLVIDIKKLASNNLDYVAKCAKRVCEIVDEKKGKHFVELLCTGTNQNTMKIAWGYAKELGVDIGMNSSKSPSQYNELGFGWANLSASALISNAGGSGSIDPSTYPGAGVAVSVYSVDKNRYNGDSVFGESTWSYYAKNIGLFRTICSNYPKWLIDYLSTAARKFDGIQSLDDFKAFQAELASDPYAVRFQNAEGEVVLKTDLEIGELSPLYKFSGVFDGGGKTISYTYNGSANKVGLFQSFGGTVRNLTVSGKINVTDGEKEAHIGGFAAEATDATFSDCTSKVEITVKETAAASRCFVIGGFVGKAAEGLIVTDCKREGAISFTSAGYCLVGGILGGTAADNGVVSITGTKVSGNISYAGSNTSDWHYVGGLTGKMQSELLTGSKFGLVISGCECDGTIKIDGSAKVRVGGIASYAKVCNTISDSKFLGTIAIGAASGERNVGGICGFQETTCDANIKNCTFAGKIDCANGASKAYWIGGIISTGYSATSIIDGCKTTASSSVTNLKMGSIGMIAARPNNALTIKNCKIAGKLNKDGQETVISESNIEDWMFKGFATTADVNLLSNGFNKE